MSQPDQSRTPSVVRSPVPRACDPERARATVAPSQPLPAPTLAGSGVAPVPRSGGHPLWPVRRHGRWLGRLLALLFLLGGVWSGSARPAAAEAPPGSLSELEARLQHLVKDYGVAGESAVAVTDLQTGETIAVAGDRRHLSACSINLFVLLRSVLDVQSGRIDREAVDALVQRTIYSSNAVTAHELYAIAGRGDVRTGLRRVAALMRRIGLEDSVLDHPPGFRESLGRDPNNWLTAREVNQALAWVWSDPALSDDSRAYLLERMTGVKPGLNYLTAVTPASVSHKNGFFPATDGTYVDNDVALIRFHRGGHEYAYALSFFSQWVPVRYGDVALGQQVTLEVWEYFDRRYPER